MSRRALFILGCGLLLGGGLLAIYLLQQLQPYDKLVNHGPAPEARANPYLAADRGYVDRVIMPHETRIEIVKALRALQSKRQVLPPKKHGNIPL